MDEIKVTRDPTGTRATVVVDLDEMDRERSRATRALGVLLVQLFDDGVRRVEASVDARDVTGWWPLERHGFELEGTARQARSTRASWVDEARFGLLVDDWHAWRERPTGAPDHVALVELTRERLVPVLRLAVAPSQQQLVAPVRDSLAEALVPPVEGGEPRQPWVRVVEADGVPTGFVMVAEPSSASPHPYLWRLLVDRRHQGRGIGARTVQALATDRRARGDTDLEVSYVADFSGSPEPFYRQLGFEPTGKVEDGEVYARLPLA